MIDPRMQLTSRRRLFSLGGAGGMMNLLGISCMAQVISGNLFAGPAQIKNLSKHDVQIGLNAASV
jgi:hypothetical protein